MTIARSCIDYAPRMVSSLRFAGMWQCVPVDMHIVDGGILLSFEGLNAASDTTKWETDGSNSDDDNNRWREPVRNAWTKIVFAPFIGYVYEEIRRCREHVDVRRQRNLHEQHHVEFFSLHVLSAAEKKNDSILYALHAASVQQRT